MSTGDDKPIDMPDSLAEAERFKRLFVDPACEAMAQRIELHLQPIISGQRKLFAKISEQDKKIESHEQDITSLKGAQKKALLGWGAFATVFGIAWGTAFGWIRDHLRLGK